VNRRWCQGGGRRAKALVVGKLAESRWGWVREVPAVEGRDRVHSGGLCRCGVTEEGHRDGGEDRKGRQRAV
jgi:hypothetical protein